MRRTSGRSFAAPAQPAPSASSGQALSAVEKARFTQDDRGGVARSAQDGLGTRLRLIQGTITDLATAPWLLLNLADAYAVF